ncbi:hypothetical protein [Streptomyces brasiliensis]|uniref:hypothetical protein n=1 Tax=Streptomyces brasiliensis TaxID=1954 RepID=UPI001671417C|nr:hypothetical protein [Streptomyces brasiliensis]
MQSATQPAGACGKTARTSSAAASAVSGASVQVRTRAGERLWLHPGAGWSMSCWLRSVTASRMGRPG